MEKIPTVESLTLKELFDKQQTLAIPEYQRPYVWSLKEIKKLLVQFKQHQVGTISFEAGVAKSSRPDELQRLIGATPMATANGRN